MKLMKHITIAMVLCAIPAMAFGQAGAAEPVKVAVAGCEGGGCYTVPYFKGDVGVVVKAMGDVAWVSTCGPVTMSDTMMMATDEEPGGHMKGDVLVMSFMDGMGCHADKGGSLTIHGADSGGWYWVNGMNNSAVSTLLPYELMGTGEMMMPALPDGTMHTSMDDATMVMGGPGLIGIIPHHNAMAPMPDPAMCAGNRTTNECMVHATNSLMMQFPKYTDPDGYSSRPATPVMSGDTIARSATAGLTLQVGLMGSGYIGMHGQNPLKATDYSGAGYLAATITGKMLGVGPGMDDSVPTDSSGSVRLVGPMADNTYNLNIVRGTSPRAANYCGGLNNHSLTIELSALPMSNTALVPNPLATVDYVRKAGRWVAVPLKSTLTITCGK